MMCTPTNSLNNIKELANRLDPAKNRYQPITFQNQLERAELRKKLEQSVPSQLLTALNATKIAPAIFFVQEKLAAALEALKNGLGSHQDLLTAVPKNDSPSLPPAPSNRIRNLLIGGGITTAALGVAYVAASYNFFGNLSKLINASDTEPDNPVSPNISQNLVATEKIEEKLNTNHRMPLDKFYWKNIGNNECELRRCKDTEGCFNEDLCDFSKQETGEYLADYRIPLGEFYWINTGNNECEALKCKDTEGCFNEDGCDFSKQETDERLADYRIPLDEYYWIDIGNDECAKRKCEDTKGCFNDDGCDF